MVKITRSYPAPESLKMEAKKKEGSYSKPDVVARLKEDFHDKCYICEMKGLQDPQIEHLLPHKNGRWPDRKFDWENLFWACGHCNRVKSRRKYEEGILNCCQRDPEDAMVFHLRQEEVEVWPKSPEDREAVLTSELVEEVFNLENTGMRIVGSAVRTRLLQEEMNTLYKKLEAYRKNPGSKLIQRTLRALLKRDTAFAGFKRCYVRERAEQYPELQKYIA